MCVLYCRSVPIYIKQVVQGIRMDIFNGCPFYFESWLADCGYLIPVQVERREFLDVYGSEGCQRGLLLLTHHHGGDGTCSRQEQWQDQRMDVSNWHHDDQLKTASWGEESTHSVIVHVKPDRPGAFSDMTRSRQL